MRRARVRVTNVGAAHGASEPSEPRSTYSRRPRGNLVKRNAFRRFRECRPAPGVLLAAARRGACRARAHEGAGDDARRRDEVGGCSRRRWSLRAIASRFSRSPIRRGRRSKGNRAVTSAAAVGHRAISRTRQPPRTMRARTSALLLVARARARVDGARGGRDARRGRLGAATKAADHRPPQHAAHLLRHRHPRRRHGAQAPRRPRGQRAEDRGRRARRAGFGSGDARRQHERDRRHHRKINHRARC